MHKSKERGREKEKRTRIKVYMIYIPESMNAVNEFGHVPHVINISHYWIEYLHIHTKEISQLAT